jgi:hypothetical protein
VQDAPTHFGKVSCDIASAPGQITAKLDLPDAKVVLHLRHPQSAPIQTVTVNGQEWKAFNKEKETIELKGLTGTAIVTVRYGGCRP